MFTGIITGQGVIKDIQESDDVARWEIAAPKDFCALPIGASVACSGACLTVMDKTATTFAVQLTSETLDCTNFKKATVGATLNLEKAMRANDTLDGHILTGHIDGVVEIESLHPRGEQMELKITAPAHLSQFIAAKGSVALDGVSLTVNAVDGNSFTLMLIPHTLKVLGWHELKKGTCFNLEIDLLSRYVARHLERRRGL